MVDLIRSSNHLQLERKERPWYVGVLGMSDI